MRWRDRCWWLTPLLVVGAQACSGGTVSVREPDDDASAEDADPRDDDARDAAAEPPFDEQEQAGWALADVSILFPLDTSLLLAADELGRGGPLLPKGLSLPRISLPQQFASLDDEYAALWVTAARLDPCFVEDDAHTCQPQIRLILQAINDRGAVDSAFHAFYTVSADEVRALAERLRRARLARQITVDRGALEVHPTLRAELAQPSEARSFTAALRAALLEHIGAANLTRVTVMALDERANQWDFASFAVQNAALAPMPLPQTPSGTTRQILVSHGMGGVLQMILTPDSTADDSLQPVFQVNTSVEPALGDEMLGRARRIEDPRRHHQGSLDCVNCHVAPAVRGFLESRQRNSAQPSFSSSLEFSLDDRAFINTGNVHVFSYRGKVPLIAPRVVHESVVVLEQLEDRSP